MKFKTKKSIVEFVANSISVKKFISMLVVMIFIVTSTIATDAFALTGNSTYENDNSSISSISKHVDLFAAQMADRYQVDSIKSLIDDTTIYFTYDYNGNRIVKQDGSGTIYYSYDVNNNLIQEQGDCGIIEYIISNGITIGFKFNEKTYYYLYDSNNNNVIGINDSNNAIIVKYEYDERNNTIVFGQDNSGAWINMESDSSFLGNINPYRFAGFYYDKDSGYYYYGGRYYNAQTGRYYIEDESNLDQSDVSSYYTSNISSEALSSAYTTTDVDSFANFLLANPEFGTPVNTYTELWYSTFEGVQNSARLIYAENNVNLTDQPAIAWVLINRYNANTTTYGGQSIYDIVTKKSQFSSIHPDPQNVSQAKCISNTYNARVPQTGYTAWTKAVWYACAISLEKDRTLFANLVPKPTGIDKQCNFISTYLASSDMSASGGSLMYKGVSLKNVCIVTKGTNLTDKTLINNYANYYYNVFFSYTNDTFS